MNVGMILAGVILLLSFTVFFGAPYVPSKKSDLKTAFTKLYKVGKGDFVIDLGAGDGVVLKTAAELGANGEGYELNPIFALVAKLRLRKYPETKIALRNYLKVKFPAQTTVVYVFSESRDIEKIAEKIQNEAERLGHEIYLVSYAFQVPDKKPEKKVGAHFLYKFTS